MSPMGTRACNRESSSSCLKKTYPSPPKWLLPAPRQGSVCSGYFFVQITTPSTYLLAALSQRACTIHCSSRLTSASHRASVVPAGSYLCGCARAPDSSCLFPCCVRVCADSRGGGLSWGSEGVSPIELLPRHPHCPPLLSRLTSLGHPVCLAPACPPLSPHQSRQGPCHPSLTCAHLAGIPFRAVMCPSLTARVSWCLRMGSL